MLDLPPPINPNTPSEVIFCVQPPTTVAQLPATTLDTPPASVLKTPEPVFLQPPPRNVKAAVELLW